MPSDFMIVFCRNLVPDTGNMTDTSHKNRDDPRSPSRKNENDTEDSPTRTGAAGNEVSRLTYTLRSSHFFLFELWQEFQSRR
jgi:hypothetical protein